jgi:microcystin-dependent protein
MDQAYIATITCFGGNFAPRNWQFCNGQLLSIAQNTALFSLLGTTFGGNGQTTFALPDLRGRVPIGAGAGPGLSSYVIGESAGSATVTLTINNLPAHVHNGNMQVSLPCDSGQASEAGPDGMYPASVPGAYATSLNPTTMKAPTYSNVALLTAGGSQPVPIMPPYTGVNYIICLFGVFPSRN